MRHTKSFLFEKLSVNPPWKVYPRGNKVSPSVLPSMFSIYACEKDLGKLRQKLTGTVRYNQSEFSVSQNCVDRLRRKMSKCQIVKDSKNHFFQNSKVPKVSKAYVGERQTRRRETTRPWDPPNSRRAKNRRHAA